MRWATRATAPEGKAHTHFPLNAYVTAWCFFVPLTRVNRLVPGAFRLHFHSLTDKKHNPCKEAWP